VTRRIVKAGVLVLALVGLLLFAVAQRGNPEIAIERNLVYGKGGDTDLLLDLAMPRSGVGPFPAVMFLHGRGWREGSRHDMSQFIEGMAGLGYVSVTSEYRLVPAARFPAQVEDCKAAVRWLRANAAKFRIDVDHIGVVGFSAGGHLASMLGVTGPGDGFEGTGGNPGQSSRVQAVVSFFGPTDFSTRDWPGDLEREVIVPFLGGSIAERPDTYRKASPYNYAAKDAPPFLFFHGSEDELVPVDQSKRMADKLTRAGVSAEVVVFDHEHHGFRDAANQIAMRRMLDFLGERLRK
jgi:acetyl esterase/lipase